MKQNYLLKLAVFIVIQAAYLYMFDPSTLHFIEASKKLIELHFDYIAIITVICWLIGFLAIIIFLNLSNNKFRILSWTLFCVTYSISFLYKNTLHQKANIEHTQNFMRLFEDFSEVKAIPLVKFIAFTMIFFGFSKIIKPLAIECNKYFLIILSISIFIAVIILQVKDFEPMQVMFMIPAVFICGGVLKFFEVFKFK